MDPYFFANKDIRKLFRGWQDANPAERIGDGLVTFPQFKELVFPGPDLHVSGVTGRRGCRCSDCGCLPGDPDWIAAWEQEPCAKGEKSSPL